MSIFIEQEPFSQASERKKPVYRPKEIRIEQCRGCKSCMLACSYHHRRDFSIAHSSISVTRNNQNGIVEWSVNSTCDDCAGESEPQCVKYCAYGVLTIASEEST